MRHILSLCSGRTGTYPIKVIESSISIPVFLFNEMNMRNVCQATERLEKNMYVYCKLSFFRIGAIDLVDDMQPMFNPNRGHGSL